jgi:hypothetical protein
MQEDLSTISIGWARSAKQLLQSQWKDSADPKDEACMIKLMIGLFVRAPCSARGAESSSSPSIS